MKTHTPSIVYLVVFILLLPCMAQAQRDNVWILGDELPGAAAQRLNFTHNVIDTQTYYPNISIRCGANICDTNGNLLYYTNGNTLYNSNNNLLYNSKEFNPGYLSDTFYGSGGLLIPEMVIFLPHPDSPSLYYVFANGGRSIYRDSINYDVSIHTNVSIIDARLDKRLGGIVLGKKAMPLGNDTILNYITAVKHADGKSWWLVTHGFFNDTFIEWLVTGDTILGPYKQSIGSIVRAPYQSQIIFSPDGQSLCAMQDYGGGYSTDNSADIYNFDRCTGIISNWRYIPRIVNPQNDFIRGCSFSPTGHYVYICDATNIFQYDITVPNPSTTQTVVATWDGTWNPNETWFDMMQLAPDGRIYVSTYIADQSMHYIQYPDSAGTKCNVVQNGVQFTAYDASNSIPLFPFYRLGPSATYAASAGPIRYIYQGDTTLLGLTTAYGCSYIWQPVKDMDNPRSAQPRVWPGATTTYTVTVTDTLNKTQACAIQTYTVEVQVVGEGINTLLGTPNIIVPTFITDATMQWAIINKPPVISATLYNVLGQSVFHADNYNNDFDMRILANGLYIYVLQTPDGKIWIGKLEVMK